MNKAELVSRMAEKSELTKKEAEMALNALMESIQEALVSGDKVQLVGFGTFENMYKPKKPTTRNRYTSFKSSSIQSWKIS